MGALRCRRHREPSCQYCVTCLTTSEWILQRWALRREHLRTALCDVHIIFQAHAEFPMDVNAGLVAESHATGEGNRIASHQVRPLVAIHSDSMTYSVGKELVIRAVAGVGHDLTRGGIDGLAF